MGKGGYERRRIEEKKQQQKQARKRARRNRLILNWLVGAGVVVLVAAVALVVFTGGGKSPKAASTPTPSSGPCTTFSPKTKFKAAPPMSIDTAKSYTATMKTSLGTMTVKLHAKEAPKTVNNFVFLARQKFYDCTIFHRIIPDFGGPGSDMIQGGDGTAGNGTGDPGYAFGDEHMVPFTTPGSLAMANSGPGTNGSQFFILDGTVSHLNRSGSCPSPQGGCHSVFGQVTQGLDIAKKIATTPRDASDKPNTNVFLISVTVTEG